MQVQKSIIVAGSSDRPMLTDVFYSEDDVVNLLLYMLMDLMVLKTGVILIL